ncbi:ImmA/IrrE family metallo-endopeptidase [Halomonas sp. YLB-10]|uniref:ImmA/IrrE family metallo-endopeptidase n=1 Tax=Halomonas sp. YLB-10 TaxID=2483111 RepID=UPI000F5D7721|nr:ImmA/IrrE family metallo-endopeptidase [Halomonas sp. YLB-10]RQW70335.1 ImmA/IrrE family metallo-endopeptidase [Halomonas sp. YLB-10]
MSCRKLTTKVTPQSRESIQCEAQSFRDTLELSAPKVPIVHIYEVLQHVAEDELDLEVLEDDELPDEEAKTFPDTRLVQVRQSVYDAAFDGHARSRFTLAHELGHYFMHRDQPASFSRATNFPIFCDSEWQADRFASELLIDRRLFDSSWSVEQIMETFGVSRKAAKIALDDKLDEEKKKGHS